MKKILSLDPGGTTGWALWQTRKGNLDDYTVGHLGPGDHHAELWSMIRELCKVPDDFRIVCESFEFRQGDHNRHKIVLDSKEYIGVVKLMSQLYDIPVVFQTASVGKTFCTDEKIKALDLWTPGMKHAMDALRHLITYQVQRQRRYDIVQKWKHLA
jgi:hypothetical protein